MTDDPKQAVIRWLQEAVIGLKLCPFAEPVHLGDRIKYASLSGTDAGLLCAQILEEIAYLDSKRGKESTSLIMLHDLVEFEEFLDLYYDAADLVAASPYNGRYQLASFHPHYVFADSDPSSLDNYTNRSPVPIIHIINEQDISRAVDFYKDVEKIPDRNKETLRRMGRERVLALFRQWYPISHSSDN